MSSTSQSSSNNNSAHGCSSSSSSFAAPSASSSSSSSVAVASLGEAGLQRSVSRTSNDYSGTGSRIILSGSTEEDGIRNLVSQGPYLPALNKLPSAARRITEIPPDEKDDDAPSSNPPIASSSVAITEAAAADIVDGSADANASLMDVSTSDAISQDEREDENAGANEDDESDYEYDYEDEDEHHFTGFLLPTDDHGASANKSHASQSNITTDTVVAANVIDHYQSDTNPTEDSPASRSEPTVSTTRTASESQSAESENSNNDSVDLPKRKSTWREPSQQAVSMSLRAEKERTGGRRRLASDLYKVMMGDTKEQGFSMEPSQEDSMDKWKIKLFGFDEESNLHKDMVALGVDHVELEMSFPDGYPFEPPFVRVVRPRFKRQTGFVMNGALCMELLTGDGWNPINDIESVIVSIRSLLVVGDGRLAAAANLPSSGSDSRKKPAAVSVKQGGGKGGRRGANDEGLVVLQDGDASQRGGKRQKGAGGRAAAAGAGGADAEEDDTMDEGDGSDEESVSGKGRNKRSSSKISASTAGSYSAAEARAAYSHLSDYHKKKGWDSSGWWARKG